MRLRRSSIAALTAALVIGVLAGPVGIVSADEGTGTPTVTVAANSLLPLAIPATETACDDQGNPISTGEPWPLGTVITVPFCVNALPIQGQPWIGWGGSSTAELQDAILNPNNPALGLPADVPAVISNGFRTVLADAVNTYQGLVIHLPMSDAFVDAGPDSAFHVVAVATFAVENAKLRPQTAGDCGPPGSTYGCLVGIFLPKPASVTPDVASKVYGAPDPTLSGSLTGFLASDGVTATFSRVAGESVVGSPYAVSATLSPASALEHYTITYNTGTFAITPAPLSVTATDVTRVLGASVPSFAVTYSAFANDETPAVLGGSPAVAATTVINTTAPAVYILRPSGLTSTNYALTFVDGRLTTKYAICPLFDGSKPATGASVPVKLSLCNAVGANLSRAGITLTAIEIDRGSTKVATASGTFKFEDKLTSGGGYQYKVPTKGLVTGQRITYTLIFRVSTDVSGVYQAVNFVLK